MRTAPVVVIDGKVIGSCTPAKLEKEISQIKSTEVTGQA